MLAVVQPGVASMPEGMRMGMAGDEILRRYRAGERMLVDDIEAVEAPSDVERSLLALGCGRT